MKNVYTMNNFCTKALRMNIMTQQQHSVLEFLSIHIALLYERQ